MRNYCPYAQFIAIIGHHIRSHAYQSSVFCKMSDNKVSTAKGAEMKGKLWMEAGTKYLSNSTFHSIPWLMENLPLSIKVRQ